MLGGLSLIASAACFGDDLPRQWMEVAITMCGGKGWDKPVGVSRFCG